MGVPLMEDTLIIQHTLLVNGNYVDFGADLMIVEAGASIVGDTIFSLHSNLRMYGLRSMKIVAVGDGDSVNVYGTMYGGKFVPGNINNHNYGSILSDSLVAGANFDNFNEINSLTVVTGGSYFRNHTGSKVHAYLQLILGSTTTVNEAGAIFDCGSLVTCENCTNNGDISCTDWTHGSGNTNGMGRFCISNCFMNVSSISGTLDVCDASPGGFCDFNFGTIAGTVTSCTAGPCSTQLAIDELSKEPLIYPNPVTDVLHLKEVPDNTAFYIYSLDGREMLSGYTQGESTSIDASSLAKGTYFILLGNEGSGTRFFKKI